MNAYTQRFAPPFGSESPEPEHNPWKIVLVIFIALLILAWAVRVFAMDYQQQIVAETIAAEAANQGETGMYLVANTIRNRALLYQKTPYQIVTQKNQYYGYTARNRHKLYLQVKSTADFLACNLMQLPDKTNGALYFRRPDERLFAWCKVETIRYGEHIFYKGV